MNPKKITEYLNTLDKEGIPAVDCIIYKDHEPIYRYYTGYSDRAKTKRLCGEEAYLMYSATKLVTMTSILQLVEQGKISLEDPVGDYLPEYRNLKVLREGKITPIHHTMRIKHLLSMQSGLDYDLQRPGIVRILGEKGQFASTLELVNSFVESPLKFEPGEHFEYSLSHDVAGAIIEVVSGKSLGEYYSEYIFNPLEMTNTFFANQFNVDNRLVSQYRYDEEKHVSYEMELTCEYQLSQSYESGGAGLISCITDYGKFADTLACGGVSARGIRILKEATVTLMRTNMLGRTQRDEFMRSMGRKGYGYGCGVQILLEPEQCNTKAPSGIFGWDGAAGAFVLMDPMNRISLVYLQHVRECGYACSTIHPTLRNLLYY